MPSIAGLTLGLLGAANFAHGTVKARQVYQFPNSAAWIENVAIRPNGHLILDTFDNGTIYTIDPNVKDAQPQVAVKVPDATIITGITEIAPDIFAVSGGLGNDTDQTLIDGTAKIITLDFNQGGHKTNGVPTIKTSAKFPAVKLLNGLAALPSLPYTVFSGDSGTGLIYRVNLLTGEHKVILDDPKLKPTQYVPFGVNGLKVHNGYIYIANTAQGFYGRVKIDLLGNVTGKVEVIASFPADPPLAADDFSIARDGTAYVGTHPNALIKITPDGKISAIDTGLVVIESATATTLSADEKTVYVVTAGETDGKGGQVISVSL
ncbi:Putative hetero-Diels-Alderase asR5-like protein [Cladobotryum mycophilum]|uniref:Hetero-Diels-Alderase asR5-like protein n=1 Tax=Cladobotryum mycophilum TaxID=491253 RepID=A0ABR0T419_9HYPO